MSPFPRTRHPLTWQGQTWDTRAPRCSAEVIAERYRPGDAALRAVAEVVHDLDLKDEGFGRGEAPGLKRLLDGICALTVDDAERIGTPRRSSTRSTPDSVRR